MHPSECKILAENFRKLEAHKAEQGERSRGRRVIIEHGDGFNSLKSLLPPPSRRALVLIDPPYELKDDYKRVRDALDDALQRFPAGVFAVWYPVLQRMESRQFADRLKRLPAKEWLNVTLTIQTPTPDGTGLHSSGMFILNPPYTLEPMLREVMPYLVRVLGKDAGARFMIEKGTQVTGAAAGRLVADTPRTPVGNARRASPLSGKGSLRLPGQSMPRDEEDPRGLAPAPHRSGGRDGARDGVRTERQPARGDAPGRGGPRPAGEERSRSGGAGPRGRSDGAAPRDAAAGDKLRSGPRTGSARPASPGAPRGPRTRQGGGRG